jgi:hypothetical protein
MTARGNSPVIGGWALWGVVVLDHVSDPKKKEAVLKAHKESRKRSRAPDPKVMEPALKVMEKR